MPLKPWAIGARELLDHANGHIKSNTAFDNRIAMISIDNAVELAIRSFLELPKRIRNEKSPSRNELEQAINFPILLDLLEKYSSNKLSGIDLGSIEWYHRIRNTLYHMGNGITVDSQHVDSYFKIASILFDNLFQDSYETTTPKDSENILPNEFIIKWTALERRISFLAHKYLPKFDRGNRSILSLYDGLIEKEIISSKYRPTLDKLYKIRNSYFHSSINIDSKLIDEYIKELERVFYSLPKE